MVELFVFVVAAAGCLAGAVGVVLNRNPVHAALCLVGTLFSIAVLFIAQEASFLAAVQVIVYAGAIVILFLFVIMLLGVDRAEDLSIEPLGGGQRIAAVIVGLAVFALPVVAIASTGGEATGAPANALQDGVADIEQLGQSLFTDYLFAFEITSVLLVIAVVGAVVLSRKVRRDELVDDPLVAAHQAELAAQAEAAEAKAQAAESGDGDTADGGDTETDEPAEVDA